MGKLSYVQATVPCI